MTLTSESIRQPLATTVQLRAATIHRNGSPWRFLIAASLVGVGFKLFPVGIAGFEYVGLFVLSTIMLLMLATVFIGAAAKPRRLAVVCADGVRFDGALAIRRDDVALLWHVAETITLTTRSRRAAVLELHSGNDVTEAIALLSNGLTESDQQKAYALYPWARAVTLLAYASMWCLHYGFGLTVAWTAVLGSALIGSSYAASRRRAMVGYRRISIKWTFGSEDIEYGDIVSVNNVVGAVLVHLRAGGERRLTLSRAADPYLAYFIRIRMLEAARQRAEIQLLNA
jgi:hypothetical protein